MTDVDSKEDVPGAQVAPELPIYKPTDVNFLSAEDLEKAKSNNDVLRVMRKDNFGGKFASEVEWEKQLDINGQVAVNYFRAMKNMFDMRTAHSLALSQHNDLFPEFPFTFDETENSPAPVDGENGAEVPKTPTVPTENPIPPRKKPKIGETGRIVPQKRKDRENDRGLPKAKKMALTDRGFTDAQGDVIDFKTEHTESAKKAMKRSFDAATTVAYDYTPPLKKS